MVGLVQYVLWYV